MAKLHEQRWMVKSLRNFYKNTGYSLPTSYSIRMQQVIQNAIPQEDFTGYIATRMTWQDRFTCLFRKKYFESPKYQLQRTHKNSTLFDSCLADGFIVAKIEEVYDDINNLNVSVNRGIRVSEKGIDLIHPLGFLEEVLKKYPTQKLIVYSIIGTLLSTAVLGTIIIRWL